MGCVSASLQLAIQRFRRASVEDASIVAMRVVSAVSCPTMLKAIFFDAAGTLIYLPRPVGEHYRDVAVRYGVELDAARINHAFRHAWASSPARPSDHQPRPDDDRGWWRNLVDRVLQGVLSADQRTGFDFDAYFEALYAHFANPGVWAVYPEVPSVLAELRARGLFLAVVSNFDRRLYAVFEHLALQSYFECIIISSEVGADKPDPYIFQHALSAMRVTPSEAIHVGDDPRCDWGAEAVGLRVLRLERPSGSLRDLVGMMEPGP